MRGTVNARDVLTIRNGHHATARTSPKPGDVRQAHQTCPAANFAQKHRLHSRIFIFRQQMIEGLILAGADFRGYGLVPLLGIVEYRINVKNNATERKNPVSYDLTDAKFRYLRHQPILCNCKHQSSKNNDNAPPVCCQKATIQGYGQKSRAPVAGHGFVFC